MNTAPATEHVEAFDTTLRDGMQVEGVSATVEDKLRIAEQLDYLGRELTPKTSNFLPAQLMN
jgi:pyruvate/oxaloacetate carboxyltransferase